MDTYRPEGWENPFTEGGRLSHLQNAPIKEYGFEAGADAMMEGLKKTGIKGESWGETILDSDQNVAYIYRVAPVGSKGWLVFIPEEA